jgi:hypothetical protein
MPRITILAAVGLFSTASLVVFCWTRLSPGHTGGRSVSSAGNGSEDERIHALEERLDALSAQVQVLATRSVSRREAGRRFSPAQAARIEYALDNPQLVEAERNRRFSGYDAAFRSEPMDAKWAPAAERDLAGIGQTDAILSIDASPPTSRNIECRSATCRLQFTFANAADAEDWSLAFATGVGRTLTRLQYAVQPQRDGSARVTMFGTR